MPFGAHILNPEVGCSPKGSVSKIHVISPENSPGAAPPGPEQRPSWTSFLKHAAILPAEGFQSLHQCRADSKVDVCGSLAHVEIPNTTTLLPHVVEFPPGIRRRIRVALALARSYQRLDDCVKREGERARAAGGIPAAACVMKTACH